MKRSQKLQNQKQRLQKSEPSKNWTLCLITVVMAMENIGILYAFDIPEMQRAFWDEKMYSWSLKN